MPAGHDHRSIRRHLIQVYIEQALDLTEEFAGAMLLGTFYLGLLFVLVLDKHISVDIVFNRLSTKARSCLWVVNILLAILYSGFLFWEGVRLVGRHIGDNVKFMTMPVPLAAISIFIPLGAGFFGLGCIARLVKQISMLITKTRGAK